MAQYYAVGRYVVLAFSVWAVWAGMSPDSAKANASCFPPYAGTYQECVAGVSLMAALRVASYQHQSEWCWAASTSMVFAFFRHNVSQERIVSDAYGKLVDMPATPELLTAGLERTWNDDDGHDFDVTAQYFDVQDNFGNLPATSVLGDIIDALSNSKPVIIGAAGHAMVLTAIKYTKLPSGAVGQITFARVLDPATGTSRPLDRGHSFVDYVAIVDVSDSDDNSDDDSN